MVRTPSRSTGDSLVRAPSRTVIAGLVAFLVVALSLFGALETLPQWVRGTAQAVGTLAGIYLGAHFQASDEKRAAEGAAKSSILNLIALAKGVKALSESLDGTKLQLRESPPKSIDSYSNAVNSLLNGLEAHSRAILAQAEAAARAWYPFVKDDDPFMAQIEGESAEAEQGVASTTSTAGEVSNS